MNFNGICENAIALNKRMREAHPELKQMVSAIAYLNDFCTVAIDLGRGVGKTKFIMDHATADDLIVCSNRAAQMEIRHYVQGATVLAADDDLRMLKGNRREFVDLYIDDPHLCFEWEKYEARLLQMFCRADAFQTVIKLGR